MHVMSRCITYVAVVLLCSCHEVTFEYNDAVDNIVIADDLFAVSVVSDEHVVAAGYWGSIYFTNDGGSSWKRAHTETKKLIYDISMADGEHGFACGQSGLLLRTEDGGKSWVRVSTIKDDQGVHFFSLHAQDPQRIWVVGEWGTRIFTEDGGKSWIDHSLTIGPTHPQFVWLSIDNQEKVRAGEAVFEDVGLTDISCLGRAPNWCWIVGEFGTIFHTSTGGISQSGESDWHIGKILTDETPSPVYLAHGETEIGPGERARVENFARDLLDRPHLNVALQPRLSRREVARLVKSDDYYPIFELIDARVQSVTYALEGAGLLSDRVRQRGMPPWDYEQFVNDDPGMLSRWIDSRLADTPRVDLEISQSPYLFSVRFADSKHGLISALGGVVLRSDDGGISWWYSDVGRKNAIFSVQPLEDKAFAIGEKGLVSISKDRGLTWKKPDSSFPPLFTFFRDIAFTDGGHVGYIVGQGGLILRTKDGGNTWLQILPSN